MSEHDRWGGAVGWLAITVVISGLAFWFGHSAGMSEAVRVQYQNAAFIQKQRDSREEAEREPTTQPTATEERDPPSPTD